VEQIIDQTYDRKFQVVSELFYIPFDKNGMIVSPKSEGFVDSKPIAFAQSIDFPNGNLYVLDGKALDEVRDYSNKMGFLKNWLFNCIFTTPFTWLAEPKSIIPGEEKSIKYPSRLLTTLEMNKLIRVHYNLGFDLACW
jgi:hypothetical protein